MMKDRLINSYIVRLQKLASDKYGADSKITIMLVREFTSHAKHAEISKLENLYQMYVREYEL